MTRSIAGSALLYANAASFAAAIGAAFVAYSGHDGWGWLIFLALMTHSDSVTINTNSPTSTGEGDGR